MPAKSSGARASRIVRASWSRPVSARCTASRHCQLPSAGYPATCPPDRSLDATELAGLASTEESLHGEEAGGGGIAGVAAHGERLGRQPRGLGKATIEDREAPAMDECAPLPIGKAGTVGVALHAVDQRRRLADASQL